MDIYVISLRYRDSVHADGSAAWAEWAEYRAYTSEQLANAWIGKEFQYGIPETTQYRVSRVNLRNE